MNAPVHTDFAAGDLWRGALSAWAAFLVMMLSALILAGVVSDFATAPTRPGDSALALLPVALTYALGIGGAVSLVVTLLVMPVAALLAHWLRGVRARAGHLAVFATLGAVIGAAAVAVTAGGRVTGGSFPMALAALVIAMCAAATTFGWWRAERYARRTRGPGPQ